MATGAENLLRYLRRLMLPSQPEGASDAVLLGRFLATRDEEAFAALIQRHGPMVYHVCRRILDNPQDTEDAFQAVFLVLARKAAAIHPRDALPAWLHGVARRVALKARTARLARAHGTLPGSEPSADPRPDPLAEISGRELLLVLDEELQQLPEVNRLPVILCCLEGRSLEEAARQLGWTRGSVKGRLERGRAQLHRRLAKRGLTLTAVLAAAEVGRGTGSAARALWLGEGIIRAATAFGSRADLVPGVSRAVVDLAAQTLTSMAMRRLPLVPALLVATTLLAVGVVVLRAALAPSPATSKPLPPRTEDKPAALGDPADLPVAVRGRVVDPQGQPVQGARLYVGSAVHRYAAELQPRSANYPVRATSGADGSFAFVFKPSELDARLLDDARPAVLAVADGFGPDWSDIPAPGEGAPLILKLFEDLPVEGRILAADGRPLPGARLRVLDLCCDKDEGVERFLAGPGEPWYPNTWRGPLPEHPGPVATDADGRFRLTGLGRGRVVALALDGPGVQHTLLRVVVRRQPLPDAAARNYLAGRFEYTAKASRTIRGVVRDRVDSTPVAGVQLFTNPLDPPVLSDAEGRFEVPYAPDKASRRCVMAIPRNGQPYFAAMTSVEVREGPGSPQAELGLVRGRVVRGKLVDRETDKPPRAATVDYYPLFPNRHAAELTYSPVWPAASTVMRPDGSFSLAVLPGPGVLCVAASPRSLYVVARADRDELTRRFHDRVPFRQDNELPILVGSQKMPLRLDRYHAVYPIDPDQESSPLTMTLSLQRGRVLEGTVVGPDGEAVTGVEVVGLNVSPNPEQLEGSSFRVEGLSTPRGRELFFLHREKGLGKVLSLKGDETGPYTVRLERCGSVHGRLLRKDGTPRVRESLIFVDETDSPYIAARTDEKGYFRAALLPGLSYSLQCGGDRSLTTRVGPLRLASGEDRDLGDLPAPD